MEIAIESEEQKALVEWLRYKKIFHFSIPNENQGSFTNRKVAMIQQRKAASMGKIKGSSDLAILLPDTILFLELKRKRKTLKNGKLSNSHSKPSKEQLAFLDKVDTFKYATAAVGYGARHSMEIIKELLGEKT